MLKVLKFGGSSLANAEQFRKAAAIINAEPERRYIVASAPGKRFFEDEKVTDLLLRCHSLASDRNPYDDTFGKIAARFKELAAELELDLDLDPELDEVKAAIGHGATADFVASRGEYFNSKILAEYLNIPFIDAAQCICFTPNGKLDIKRTETVLENMLALVPRAVIPGFYGSMPDGSIKTFSRGGSDITGSIVAAAVEADLYENWTDVSGMLMADPRIVENPAPIDVVTYRELRELSYMGATVLHEDAIFPVRKAGIPINIRNTNAPEEPGTMIVPHNDNHQPRRLVTGIAGKTGISAIYIERDMMNGELGYCRRVLETLERRGISFEHLPSGIDTVSVVLNTAAIKGREDMIIADLKRTAHPDTIRVLEDLALIAVVGQGMIQSPGTAARVLGTLAQKNINIRMIDQGSSELNIIVGISAKDFIPAMNALYKEFDPRKKQ